MAPAQQLNDVVQPVRERLRDHVPVVQLSKASGAVLPGPLAGVVCEEESPGGAGVRGPVPLYVRIERDAQRRLFRDALDLSVYEEVDGGMGAETERPVNLIGHFDDLGNGLCQRNDNIIVPSGPFRLQLHQAALVPPNQPVKSLLLLPEGILLLQIGIIDVLHRHRVRLPAVLSWL